MEEQAVSSQARELVFPAQLELRSTKRLRQKNQLASSSFQQKLSFALHPPVCKKMKRTPSCSQLRTQSKKNSAAPCYQVPGLPDGMCSTARPQLTAFFTSSPILASSAAVNSFSAKATGHRAPSSRFALSLKPNVAYLVLNLCAGWKKQTTLPSLAYAGILYQSFGERAGALALMIAWSRSPMARSGAGISPIFASTALSPSALPARGPAFSSWTRSLIAARSSSMNPSNFLPVTVVPLAAFCVPFFGGFLSAM